MRTRIRLAAFVLILIFILLGYQDKIQYIFDKVDIQESEDIIIKAIDSDPRTNEYPTKLSEFTFDLDLDNEEEKIELYTAAGHGPDGEMLWDDGQKWLLVVVDNSRYYPLLSEFVQAGQVYFSLTKVGEQMIPQLNVYLSTQSGMKIIDFVFNNQNEFYEGEVVYEPKNKVKYNTSIPGY